MRARTRRSGLSLARRHSEAAADLIHALASPELYRLLVADKGWGIDRYEHWLLDTLVAQLLAEAATPQPLSSHPA